jgi:hypothetical protein
LKKTLSIKYYKMLFPETYLLNKHIYLINIFI